MTSTDAPSDIDATLRTHFGLERFRPGQREVIEQVLQGRDVLCVMPTGGGKSLCYQLPAVIRGGVTLVVSPLIALMKDQVDSLTERGIPATLINSTLDPGEQANRIAQVEAGRFNLVYVAPERFRSGRFVSMIARVKPTLLAIDEAHCISQWGHDFRPDYARLGLARRRLGSPPCIALTATATDLVRRDIADQLNLHDPALFVAGFDRPNLSYAVIEARRDGEKLAALAETLNAYPGAAIIYASSRARCAEVATFIQSDLRRDAVVYHAGLSREQRHEAQERFMSGEAEIVVATNAFGMGVDKPDIRSVIHFNMPGTIEAYYQEAGRAGRDGRPAACVLLYAPGDRKLQELFIENEYPPQDVVFRIYNFLRKLDVDPIELTQSEIKEELDLDLSEGAVGASLRLLEGAGAIERFLPRENMAIVRFNPESAGGDSEFAAEPRSLVERLNPQAHIQRTVLLALEGLVKGRHGEPVYFHPDDFASALGLDRPALGRAIRSLVAELPIDYVPPFRGHAIRVTDRSRTRREIDIDFVELEKRKQREYDKLDRMIQYATTRKCRRAYVLGYFGDHNAARGHCGHCDNCGKPAHGAAEVSPEVATIDTPEGREVILKVLSGVARAKGRFGKTVVAQMLNGSSSEKMERFGLTGLTTFGILPDFKQSELTQLIDALAEARQIEVTVHEPNRPTINLSDSGWNFVKTRPAEPLSLNLTDELAAKVQRGGIRSAPRPADDAPSLSSAHLDANSTLPEDDPLVERLRALRSRLAADLKQPAYHIFTNETLAALVRERPTTPQALAAIKGLGPARVERFGQAMIETIRDSSEGSREPAVKAPSNRPTPPPAPSSQPRSVPTEDWTWQLLERGFTLDQIAAIRNLDQAAVIRHALLSARGGKRIPLEQLLDPETLQRWDAWRSQQENDGQPPALDPCAVELWTLFTLCRAAE